jgi:STE24 endopeptidase
LSSPQWQACPGRRDGKHYERAYGISVQGWGSWLGDQAKALGLTLVFGVPILLLFNWIVRRWRRYWLGIWVVTLPILVFFCLILPLLVPLFYQQEPLQENHAALVRETRDRRGAHRNRIFRRIACT